MVDLQQPAAPRFRRRIAPFVDDLAGALELGEIHVRFP